jgi:hypothetical protein
MFLATFSIIFLELFRSFFGYFFDHFFWRVHAQARPPARRRAHSSLERLRVADEHLGASASRRMAALPPPLEPSRSAPRHIINFERRRTPNTEII